MKNSEINKSGKFYVIKMQDGRYFRDLRGYDRAKACNSFDEDAKILTVT